MVWTFVRTPSIGARTSEFFIWASSFFIVSPSELRLRSRSIRSASTAPRSRFDPHCPINCRDGGTAAYCDHFRHRHQEIICQREKEHECCSTAQQESF